jgi:hypothetical protein
VPVQPSVIAAASLQLDRMIEPLVRGRATVRRDKRWHRPVAIFFLTLFLICSKYNSIK